MTDVQPIAAVQGLLGVTLGIIRCDITEIEALRFAQMWSELFFCLSGVGALRSWGSEFLSQCTFVFRALHSAEVCRQTEGNCNLPIFWSAVIF
jgi:hypothetical protein